MQVVRGVRLAVKAGLAGVYVISGPATAFAGEKTITGTTTTQQIITTGDILTVASGATLSLSGSSGSNSTAVRVNGTSGTATINNNGTIEQTSTGGVRAIRGQTSGITLNVNNAVGASITSLSDDTMKLAVGSGYHIDNQGTIWAKAVGQALDFADTTLPGSTIVNGSTTNTKALIRADGDNAIRTGLNTTTINYGTILSTADDAIRPGSNNTITNYGTIQALGVLGDKHDAIDIKENIDKITINNYGLLDGQHNGINGGDVNATSIVVWNYAGGEIIGRNGAGVGLDTVGTNCIDCAVYNFGIIRGDYVGTGNGDGDGVDIDGVAYIDNYGQILGTGAGGVDDGGSPNGSEGIAAGGGTIINRAGALVRGAQNGILIDDGSGNAGVAATHITNLGTIEGTTGAGIRIEGAFDNVIDNAGKISGGTDAIVTGDGKDTLTLRRGSVVIGGMDLGGGRDTLNYLQSQGAAYTFTGTAPEIVNAPGQVVVVGGNKVGIINPSMQAAAAGAFSDLTSGISDMVFGQMENHSAGPHGGSPSGMPGGMNLGMRASLKDEGQGRATSAAPGVTAWGGAFGTWTRTDGNSGLADTSSAVGGMLAGYDSSLGGGTRAGIFLGGAYGQINANGAYESSDATSVFGGLYARKALSGYDLNAALTFGGSDHDSKRTIASNLSSTGFETDKGDYWSFFVNPVVGVSSRGGFLGTRLAASARVGYAGSFTERYSETGGSGAMTFDSQNLHLFHAQAEVKLPMNFSSAHGVEYFIAPFAGIRGYTQAGDTNVSGEFVGADFNFDPGSDRSVGTAFGGLTAAVSLGTQGQAFLDVEGGRRTDDTDEFKAKAGVRWAW